MYPIKNGNAALLAKEGARLPVPSVCAVIGLFLSLEELVEVVLADGLVLDIGVGLDKGEELVLHGALGEVLTLLLILEHVVSVFV